MDPHAKEDQPQRKNFTILAQRSNDFDDAPREREPFQPIILQANPDNWSQYFPEFPLSTELRERLVNGVFEIYVALDPSADSHEQGRVGYIQITHDKDSRVYIETARGYERRGIASALIQQAQKQNSSLVLNNIAGRGGHELYTKMGFMRVGDTDEYLWEKA